MRLVALPRDPTPTGALVELGAAWLLTVAAWTWSSLDGGAPPSSWRSPRPSGGGGVGDGRWHRGGLGLGGDGHGKRAGGMGWPVSRYERSVELGAHPEVTRCRAWLR